MFCGLEQIELKVSVCPVKCQYKSVVGGCAFTELTADEVDVQTIAVVRNLKPYKVKAEAMLAKRAISIGLAIDKYADYIKESFPRPKGTSTLQSAQVVNTRGSNANGDLLREHFQLTENQQHEFWAEDRFSTWAKRNSVTFTLADFAQALSAIRGNAEIA